MSGDVPETVACPCGNGYAERKAEKIAEPGDRRKVRRIYHYRHAGCPIGGTIVVQFDRIYRRIGPLFNPGRFGFGETEGTYRPVAADGGVVGP